MGKTKGIPYNEIVEAYRKTPSVNQVVEASDKQHRMKERLSDNEILFTQITKLNAELFSQLRKLFPDYNAHVR